MSDILLALGDYRFSIETAAYQTLQRQHRYRWQTQQRVGRVPAQQFLGKDTETITLKGEILPHFKGGLAQINALRAAAETGQPQLLTDGLGNVWGKYVIVAIHEEQDDLLHNGVAGLIRFRLELKEYGEDH